jgi:hypothetical protein
MNKIINELYVPFTRKSIPIQNCGKVRLLHDDGWNGDIFSYSYAVTLQLFDALLGYFFNSI